MPVTRYLHANGVVIAQKTGSTRTDYLTDGLGSITATKNQSQQIVNTYRYAPYGRQLAKTGSGSDPRFKWTGNTGSQHTGRLYAEQYNWHRHYGSIQGQWTTVDPLWPDEMSYSYVNGQVITIVDATGLDPRCSCDYGTPNPKFKKDSKGWPIVPKTAKDKCYHRQCSIYCRTINNIAKRAIDLCDDHTSVQNNIIYFPPASQIGPYPKICHELFTEVGKAPYGTPPIPIINPEGYAPGNQSQWPNPKSQTLGTDFFYFWCKVECRLRICNDLLLRSDPEIILKRGLNQCDKNPNWDRPKK
jgi:RHS repeat-associated protein